MSPCFLSIGRRHLGRMCAGTVKLLHTHVCVCLQFGHWKWHYGMAPQRCTGYPCIGELAFCPAVSCPSFAYVQPYHALLLHMSSRRVNCLLADALKLVTATGSCLDARLALVRATRRAWPCIGRWAARLVAILLQCCRCDENHYAIVISVLPRYHDLLCRMHFRPSSFVRATATV